MFDPGLLGRQVLNHHSLFDKGYLSVNQDSVWHYLQLLMFDPGLFGLKLYVKLYE